MKKALIISGIALVVIVVIVLIYLNSGKSTTAAQAAAANAKATAVTTNPSVLTDIASLGTSASSILGSIFGGSKTGSTNSSVTPIDNGSDPTYSGSDSVDSFFGS